MIKLPPNIQVGQANGNADCFFYSVARGLKYLKPEQDFTVKSLRQVCKSFAQSQLQDEQSWLKEALIKQKEQMNEYISRIEFTENDIDQESGSAKVLGLTSPIWGRSEIEGRIICAEYGVKLQVVEKHIVELQVMSTYKIVDSDSSRSVDALDYSNKDNTVYLINTGDLHFKPLFIIKAVQRNKQQLLNLSNDNDDKDVEMTLEEKLYNAIWSNESESEKVTRIRELLKRVRKLDINFQVPVINNNTCLHIAVVKKELKVVELLLKEGAKADIKNYDNRSPLDVAKSLKRQDIINILQSSIQENGEGINRKSEQIEGILSLVDGELPPEKDSTVQSDDQTIEGQYNKVYEKKLRTICIDGKLYEIELLMLLLLQAEAKEKVNNINSFHLTTNMQEARDFNDIVFKHKYFENGVEKSNIMFFQVNHKVAEGGKVCTIDTLLSQSEKGDLLLRKYLSSYRKIKCLNFIGNHPLLQDSIDRSDFVIYTNSVWDFDKNSDCVKKENLDPEDILHFAENDKSYYYKLNATETVKSALRRSLDFEILVRELAQSVYSGSIDLHKLIFIDYHVSLADRVIQISEANKEECQFREDFLDGTQDAELSCAFLEEIRNNEKFPKTFTAESNALKKELKNKIMRIPENFGCSQDDDFNLPLPNKTIPDETIEEFLSELKLFINQPNISQLEDIIKKIIIKAFKIEQEDDANLIYCDVHSKLTKWWREQREGKYKCLTEHDKLFKKVKEKLSSTMLVGLTILQAERIKSLDFNFKRDQIERLSKLIREKRILNIFCDEDVVPFSTVKVYQALEEMTEYKSKDYSCKYIFLSLNSVLKLENIVIEAFKSERSDLLVIDCERTEKSLKQLFEQLVDIIKQNDCKRLVLITRENDPLAEQFKRAFSTDSQYVEDIDGNCTLADLDTESQADIREKKVIFQGIEMELGKLVDEKSNHLISADVFSKLVNDEEIEVDKTPGDLGKLKYYYVDRIFQRRVNIKKEWFEEKNISDIFVVSNLKENELLLLGSEENVCKFKDIELDTQSLVKFIILDDDKNVHENLKQLYTKYQTYNIHWLKKGDTFIWQQSHGSLSNLREFVDKEEMNEYVADEIFNIPDRVVIISAEPGMGKSVLLTKLAREAKKADPSLWVVRINLNDFTKQLNEMSFDKINLNGTINFLSDIVDLKSSLEKKLFKHRVENEGKIAFLFDGFDEISPEYKEKVIALVKVLKDTKIDKLWITTRPHMRDELEDNLSVLSYTLKPLSAEDQKQFLKRFWGRKLDLKDDTDDNRLNTYIEECLKVMSPCTADEGIFAGIPLQIRIVAEVYQKKLIEFYYSDQSIPDFPCKPNLPDLYQLFVYKKCDLYWSKKNKAGTTTPSESKVYDQYRSKFIMKHQLLALEIIFSDQEVDSLLSTNEQEQLKGYKEEIMEGHENTGIINHSSNGTLNFIHRTLAEYFAALWLVDKRDRCEVRNLLLSKLFETENRVLRNLFDRILANDKNKNEIHAAVLNYDVEKVKELSLDSQNSEVDKGGRTALHLAAAYGFLDIVEILLNNDAASIHVEDEILSWRPVSYADKCSHWHVAELLLQRGAMGEDMFMAMSNINSVNKWGKTLLHTAAEEGLLKFTKFLIQRNANIHAKSECNMTPLHSAASKGNSDIVKILIMKIVDFDSENKNGDTILHYAVKLGKLDVVKLLIETEADLNVQNIIGNTVFHHAALLGKWDVFKLLMEAEGDLNVQNIVGNTVLHHAVLLGNFDVVNLLIEKGVDLNVKNIVDKTVLHLAAEVGKLDILKLLIEKGADLNGKNKSGDTVLHYAVQLSKFDVVRLLIETGADLNVKNNFGITVLHQITLIGEWDVMKLLIEKGADLKIQNNNGNTPLHYAAQGRKLDIVKFLIEKEADLNSQNDNGDTALHFAAKGCNLDMVKVLMEKGADFNIQNSNGDTALMYAINLGKLDIVMFLMEKGADFNLRPHKEK